LAKPYNSLVLPQFSFLCFIFRAQNLLFVTYSLFYHCIFLFALYAFNFASPSYLCFAIPLLPCLETTLIPYITQLFSRDKFLFLVLYYLCSLVFISSILYKCYYLSYDGKYPFNNIISFIFYIITKFLLLNSCCLLL